MISTTNMKFGEDTDLNRSVAWFWDYQVFILFARGMSLTNNITMGDDKFEVTKGKKAWNERSSKGERQKGKW